MYSQFRSYHGFCSTDDQIRNGATLLITHPILAILPWVNTMPADALAPKVASVSAGMILTPQNGNMPSSASKDLKIHMTFLLIYSVWWTVSPYCAELLLGNLTHWGRDKMAAVFQTTFSNAFSWMKMYKFRIRFHWSLFPRDQLTIFQHKFR